MAATDSASGSERVAALQHDADGRPHRLAERPQVPGHLGVVAGLELTASLDVVAVAVVPGGDEHQVRPELEGGGHGDVLQQRDPSVPDRPAGTGRLIEKPSPARLPTSCSGPVPGKMPDWWMLAKSTASLVRKTSLVPSP